jgi:hypothetical protein
VVPHQSKSLIYFNGTKYWCVKTTTALLAQTIKMEIVTDDETENLKYLYFKCSLQSKQTQSRYIIISNLQFMKLSSSNTFGWKNIICFRAKINFGGMPCNGLLEIIILGAHEYGL